MTEKLSKTYSKYSDGALCEIIRSANHYTPDALSAAKKELLDRYSPLFSLSDGDFIALSAILQAIPFEDILVCLPKFIERSDYKSAFDSILQQTPFSDEPLTMELSDKNGSITLQITADNSKEPVITNLLTWKEWLTVKVKKEQILCYGKEHIAAACLIQMTVNGFDAEDTENLLAELGSNISTSDDKQPEVLPDIVIDQTDIFTKSIHGYQRQKKENQNNEVSQVRPWIRFFARNIDYMIFDVLLQVILKLSPPFLGEAYRSIKYFSISVFLWVFIEAILLSAIGTTPGKWLLKITVQNADKSRLSFRQAFRRSLMVFAFGSGLGISYIDIITNIWSYFYLKRNEAAYWDVKGRFQVTHKKIGIKRAWLAVFVNIIGFVCIYVLAFGFRPFTGR